MSLWKEAAAALEAQKADIVKSLDAQKDLHSHLLLLIILLLLLLLLVLLLLLLLGVAASVEGLVSAILQFFVVSVLA